MTPVVTLGGPGPGCSVTRIRRLVAGELEADARARAEAHLAGCARCQQSERAIADEARAAAEALPFERFAAGVAERVARDAAPASRWRSVARRVAPLALAAGLAVAVLPVVARLGRERGDGVRAKGGAALTVYVQEPGGARALAPGEAVAAGARLRVALAPAGRAHAAVLLVDADGPAVLYAGAAVAGPVPGAFEWTGTGRATLLAVYAAAPIDAPALAARVGRGGAEAAAGPGREVVTFALRRGAAP